MSRRRGLSPEEFKQRLRTGDWQGVLTPMRRVPRVEFTVPGVPRPKGRPRVTRHGTYTPQRTKDYQRSVREWFGACYPFQPPFAGPVALGVTAYGAHHAADVDNICKAVSDALNGVAYVDDRQVVRVLATKEPAGADGPRTVVVVWSLDKKEARDA